MNTQESQCKTPKQRGSSRLWWTVTLVGATLVVTIFILTGRISIGAHALTGISANSVAYAAENNVKLSNPSFEPATGIVYGDSVVISIQALNSGPMDELKIIDEETGVALAHLNDLGWPPDVKALDGLWTGRLDWNLVKSPGVYDELVFEYISGNNLIARLDAPIQTVAEANPEFTELSVNPNGRVTVSDTLLVTAMLDQPVVPGKVVFKINESFETELLDNGIAPDETAMDGCYSASVKVPVELPHFLEQNTCVNYMNSQGTVQSIKEGPTLELEAPEVYLTDLSIEPSGVIELGQTINVKASLNNTDEPSRVSLILRNDELDLSFPAGNLETYIYRNGRREFQGTMEGEMEWNHRLSEGGQGFYLTATTNSMGMLSSRIHSSKFDIKPPDVEIVGCNIAPAPPIEYGELVFIEAWTDKCMKAGSLQLLINDEIFCRLSDDGAQHIESTYTWQDDVVADGCWTGKLSWYCHPNSLEAGENQSAKLQLTIGERVYAEYELDPITILPINAKIVSMYQEPSGPIQQGDDVVFIVDFNKYLNMGMLRLCLSDGTVIASESGVSGDRVEVKLEWFRLKAPGKYGPVTAKYYTRANKLVSEFEGESLIVE